MDKQKILKDLDELDMYMFNNLGSNGRFKNINDIQAKINLDYIKRMETLMQAKEVPGVIKSRYLITKAAYEVASNMETQENLQTARLYFDYVKSMRHLAGNGVKSVQQAIDIITKAAHTNHWPDQRALNAIYSNNLTPAERRYFDLILNPMLNQIYEAIRHQEPKRETALVVQNERTSLFAKIRAKLLSIINRNKQNEEIENSTEYNNSRNSINWKDLLRVEEAEKTENKIVPKEPENIVIGDLHGNMAKWSLVEDYLKNNPKAKVYILGDATDRGDDGVRILRRIKELCTQKRAEYIPGNHDINVYTYLKFDKNIMVSSIMSKNITKEEISVLSKISNYQQLKQDERKIIGNLIYSSRLSNREKVFLRACAEFELNQGLVTMKDLDNYRQESIHQLQSGEVKNYTTPDEMCDWLGKLPIQREVPVGNNIFLLAHALPIGTGDNYYSIEQATNDEIDGKIKNDKYMRYYTTMWYRQKNTEVEWMKPSFPENYIGIVGHTPLKDDNIASLHISGNTKNNVILCIDGSRLPTLPAWNLNTNSRYEFKQKQQNEQNYLQNR